MTRLSMNREWAFRILQVICCAFTGYCIVHCHGPSIHAHQIIVHEAIFNAFYNRPWEKNGLKYEMYLKNQIKNVADFLSSYALDHHSSSLSLQTIGCSIKSFPTTSQTLLWDNALYCLKVNYYTHVLNCRTHNHSIATQCCCNGIEPQDLQSIYRELGVQWSKSGQNLFLTMYMTIIRDIRWLDQ